MNLIKTFIIAEAGVNHNGNLKLAKKLIYEAKEAGASAIKFQSFIANKSISKFAKKAEYQISSTGDTKTQLEMVKSLELSESDHYILFKECKKNKIEFISTPFDKESIDLLLKLKVNKIKVASSELNNFPFLKQVAKTKKEVILSTGMGTLLEIEKAVKLLINNGINRKKLTVLHCNTEYPTPYNDVNLR